MVEEFKPYLQTPQALQDKLCTYRIPGEERQVFDVIVRQTYGWNKPSDKIALSQFNQKTNGIPRAKCSQLLKSLLLKKVIGVTENGNGDQVNTYHINENYKEWVLLPKKVTVTENGNTSVTKKGNSTVTENGNHNIYSFKDTIKDTLNTLPEKTKPPKSAKKITCIENEARDHKIPAELQDCFWLNKNTYLCSEWENLKLKWSQRFKRTLKDYENSFLFELRACNDWFESGQDKGKDRREDKSAFLRQWLTKVERRLIEKENHLKSKAAAVQAVLAVATTVQAPVAHIIPWPVGGHCLNSAGIVVDADGKECRNENRKRVRSVNNVREEID